MKKSIITLILVLFIGTSFAQNYQVVRKIVATPDCRTRFLNSQNVQIFEVNSFDMTYNFLSNTQLQIRDYKNSVTIYKAQTSSPIFDSLPSFLDSIKTACLIFSDTAGIFGIVAGTNITIDNSNIKFPIISSSGGGGSSYSAKNGIYINSDTIKLGGNITENTKLDNPNSKSVQIGSDGDAMNLNVVPPFPYSGLISSYSGYDYRSAEYMSFIGVLKSLNFAPFGFVNQDMVGTFTIVGNPFDSIFPDGSVMVDGVWELGGQVAMGKFVFTFLGSDITFNTISMSEIENTEEIEGDNAYQLKSIEGDNALQLQLIEGNNATQKQLIIGDNASQLQSINGEDGKITRLIIDSVNNANAKEEITSTSYLFYGEKVVGSDTIKASNSISPDGFVREFKNGSIVGRESITDTKYEMQVDTILLKAQIQGFFNSTGIAQPLVPLGSSTNDVIQALQNLGLFRED